MTPLALPDPDLPEAELLDRVQRQTLRYFWDFAHPVSGLARERSNGDPGIVTTGGSGFGIMAIVAGVERGWIARDRALERVLRIARFLAAADRFHGAFPHWLDGATGRTRPFSAKDDGGDLVETSFLVAGLLAARQYFAGDDARERVLREIVDALWTGVEWDWYARNGEEVLYWHWSPRFGWEMNLPVRGWNECLITYVLAASSPSHPIGPLPYHHGWAGGPDFTNGRSYYGIRLPLGPDHGGPLFFAHYSFLGLDPRGLVDRYADYFEQNLAHTLINREYAIRSGVEGFGPDCWGLTASDSIDGYRGHSPTRDFGVITPSAALSSFPYTPAESGEALRGFLRRGSRLWGEFGFRDAFSPRAGWVAPSYLAIDQGPIVVMIENYRSGLLWHLFMSAPEIRQGLARLGFSSPALAVA